MVGFGWPWLWRWLLSQGLRVTGFVRVEVWPPALRVDWRVGLKLPLLSSVCLLLLLSLLLLGPVAE